MPLQQKQESSAYPNRGLPLPFLTCLKIILLLEILYQQEAWHHNACIACSIDQETEEPEVSPGVLVSHRYLFIGSHCGESSQRKSQAEPAKRKSRRLAKENSEAHQKAIKDKSPHIENRQGFHQQRFLPRPLSNLQNQNTKKNGNIPLRRIFKLNAPEVMVSPVNKALSYLQPSTQRNTCLFHSLA